MSRALNLGWLYSGILITSLMSGMSTGGIEDDERIANTLLDVLPCGVCFHSFIKKIESKEESEDADESYDNERYKDGFDLIEALDCPYPSVLKETLHWMGCRRGTLKHTITIKNRHNLDTLSHCFKVTPLYRVLFTISTQRDMDPKACSIKNAHIDVLLGYGFHIPLNKNDLFLYNARHNIQAVTIFETQASDPRLFGAFHRWYERVEKKDALGGPKSLLALSGFFMLWRRKIPPLADLGRDMYGLIAKVLDNNFDSLLNDHAESLLKFHKTPWGDVYSKGDKSAMGRVMDLPLDITLDQIKEKIGPAVLKNYERLLAEWKEYRLNLDKKPAML